MGKVKGGYRKFNENVLTRPPAVSDNILDCAFVTYVQAEGENENLFEDRHSKERPKKPQCDICLGAEGNSAEYIIKAEHTWEILDFLKAHPEQVVKVDLAFGKDHDMLKSIEHGGVSPKNNHTHLLIHSYVSADSPIKLIGKMATELTSSFVGSLPVPGGGAHAALAQEILRKPLDAKDAIKEPLATAKEAIESAAKSHHHLDISKHKHLKILSHGIHQGIEKVVDLVHRGTEQVERQGAKTEDMLHAHKAPSALNKILSLSLSFGSGQEHFGHGMALIQLDNGRTTFGKIAEKYKTI